MAKLSTRHLKTLAALILGLCVIATFFPLGYQRRIDTLQRDVRQLSSDVAEMRDQLRVAYTEYGAAMDRVADLVRAAAPPAVGVDTPTDEEDADRSFRDRFSRISVPGVYTSACGRVGVRVGSATWFVGDRTPYGWLSGAGPGWAEFDGRFIAVLGVDRDRIAN